MNSINRLKTLALNILYLSQNKLDNRNKIISKKDAICYLENLKYEITSLSEGQILLPSIRSIEETIEDIIVNKKSLSRFGDGEFLLALDRSGIGYQRRDEIMGKRLREILKTSNTSNPNILISIPDAFGTLERFTPWAREYWRRFLGDERDNIYNLLNFTRLYEDTLISRPYEGYQNKNRAELRFNNLKRIWAKRDVVVVEGSQSRLGYNNDLFSNTKSFSRIICPPRSAHDKYDEILHVASKTPSSSLLLLALGPTATILSYDLADMGLQAIDIGNIDIDYEWFLKGNVYCPPLKNKYIWHLENGGLDNTIQITDKKYLDQIVTIINH